MKKEIQAIKDAMGDKLRIVGHHYQNEDIIQFCDMAGDSLELARKVALETAPHIVFCGVYFMAESSALLAGSQQNIYIPDPEADCDMAKMSPAPLLEKVLFHLNKSAQAEGRKIIPLAYVNTSLAVKDVVGRYNGAVCTSANAKIMLQWALEQAGDNGQVLFLPDKNLGQNTGLQLGLSEKDWMTLDVRNDGKNNDTEAVRKAKMLLWPGHCIIHAKFSPEQIAAMRSEYKDCKVVVHPECTQEVVNAADGSGSTTYLIQSVKNSPKGSTVIVGTEGNLVERLRDDYAEHCQVVPLCSVYCDDMAKINLDNLLQTLQGIQNGSAKPVQIPQEQVKAAKLSLERMLEVCAMAGI